MKPVLRVLMPITLTLALACSGNQMEVGSVIDAGQVEGPGDRNRQPLPCDYLGRLYNDGETKVDACNCTCDGQTGQFVCSASPCVLDAGTQDTAEAWCEYNGVLVSESERIPADDGCNLCSCNPAVRRVMCSMKACLLGQSGAGLDKLAACPSWAGSVFITLGTILGVGKSPTTGTIYVVDQVGATQRVFVSSTEGAVTPTLVLKRQVVNGTGSGPDFLVLNSNGPDAIVTVQIDTPAGQPKRMGVVQGILEDRKTMVIGQDGEELTVLNDSDIAGLYLRNLPQSVTTEYAAATEDGRNILVVRPTYDWTYEDFRVFLGSAAKMTERGLVKVSRAKDGGSTKIVFDLDGSTATADFPVIRTDAGFGDGPATLTIDAQILPLARLSAPPANALYVCGGSPAQCRWPAAVEPKDAGAENQCRAGRYLASCDLGNGTWSSGLRDELGGCSSNCASNEYGLACGTIGPSSSPAPEPPAGCHTPLYTPGGLTFYCCPCF